MQVFAVVPCHIYRFARLADHFIFEGSRPSQLQTIMSHGVGLVLEQVSPFLDLFADRSSGSSRMLFSWRRTGHGSVPVWLFGRHQLMLSVRMDVFSRFQLCFHRWRSFGLNLAPSFEGNLYGSWMGWSCLRALLLGFVMAYFSSCISLY
jgi:hypothetical protein